MTTQLQYQCNRCGDVYSYPGKCECGGQVVKIRNEAVNPVMRQIVNQISKGVEA